MVIAAIAGRRFPGNSFANCVFMSTPSVESGLFPESESSAPGGIRPPAQPPREVAVATESSPGASESATASPAWRWHWSLFAALALCAAMLLNHGTPWLFGVVDTLGNFRWQLVFLCGCLAVYQLVNRRFVWALVIVGLIALPSLRMASLYVPATQPPPGLTKLRVLTLNLYNKNGNHPAVSELIRQSDADVVNLIEFDENWQSSLHETMREYPYCIMQLDGNAIFSRLPAEPFEARHPFFSPIEWLTTSAKLTVDEQPVLIVTVHPISPTSLGRLLERDAQITMLEKPLAQLPQWHHVVLVGDFNATTNCHSMRSLISETGLRDTRQGFGIQSSWPTWFWPLAICIDQGFVSDDVHVHRRETGPHVGSDHLPVILELSFNEHEKFRRQRTNQQIKPMEEFDPSGID